MTDGNDPKKNRLDARRRNALALGSFPSVMLFSAPARSVAGIARLAHQDPFGDETLSGTDGASPNAREAILILAGKSSPRRDVHLPKAF
jgi:hypothetical protein